MLKPLSLIKIKKETKKKFNLYPMSKKAGLYSIRSIINSRFYIGESCNVIKRLNAHKNLLKRGIHTNRDLQKDFTLYGEKNFSFKSLQIGYGLELKTRQNIETLILTTLEPENRYNTFTNWRKRNGLLNPFFGKTHTLLSRQSLSETMAEKPSPFLGKKQTNRVKELLSRHNKNGGNRKKPLYIDGIFYDSILHAHLETGLNRRLIRERCSSLESRYSNYYYAN